MSILKKKYHSEVRQKLQEKFGYKNPMCIPKLTKIVVNMGVAEITKDKNALQDHVNELALITGQAPVVTKAKTSISNFKLREGQPVGIKTTLRGTKMYDFLYRFCNIVCPRIRDFRGFKVKGDGRGSYSIGIDDQQVFPEINLDDVKRTQGMNITIVTTAETDAECHELLKAFGFPYENN